VLDSAWDMWAEEKVVEPKPVVFNSNKLAAYFRQQLSQAAWSSGFSSVNHAALVGTFAKWKRAGVTTKEATDMVDAYMSSPELRGKNPGWQDFLYHKEQIAVSLKTPVVVDEWDLLAEEER
jgi:hypothetical protein